MNGKTPVSVIVMTKNEEKNIGKCLAAVRDFDEVFVIDSVSTDSTCALAREFGAKVVEFRWDGKYPKKKQWCLEKLPFRNDFVLYVDADEVVSDELASEIRRVMESGPQKDGYFVGFDYVFMGRVLKHGHRVYKLVLMNRHKSRYNDYDDLGVENKMEIELHYQPMVKGAVGVLKHRMIHDDHKNLFTFYDKLNKYSEWEAHLWEKGRVRIKEQSSITARKIAQGLSDRLPFRGLAIFFYSYIVRLGFLDGTPGLQFSLALGYYYSMISSKRIEKKLKERRDAKKNI